MIRNNLSWINLNVGSSGGGGGVSDYNDLANRPIISMTGTSQNPLKLWNLSTGLYLLNGYVYYDTTNTRECVNLFVSITAQIQNGKYVLSAFVPSWEGHYEYIKANSTSTDYTDTQILKMLTEDDVLTLTNEVEYVPTTDYHPSTKKYVDEAMQSVMEEFAKMGVNEQDIKTLIAENRRRDIAIQALLNETADKNVTIEEDTHTISLDYSMEDGMATVNSIEGSTLVNVSKTVDEVYVTKSQNRVEQSKVANTIGEQNGKLCPIIEGDTLVNVCDQKDPIAITKSYTVENSGNHIALQGEYDGKCRPVVQGNTMVNLVKSSSGNTYHRIDGQGYISNLSLKLIYPLKASTTYTRVVNVTKCILGTNSSIGMYDGVYNFDETYKQYPYGTRITGVGVYINTFTTTDASSTTNLAYDINPDNLAFDGTTGAELEISNLMIFEGDLTQTPELIPTEYIEGLKSSFEDNIVTQAMVDSGEESSENLGKYKVEYKVTGKNLINEKTLTTGTYSIDGTSENNWLNYAKTDFIQVKANINYIMCNLTYNDVLINTTDMRVGYYDVNKKFIKSSSVTDGLFTTTGNTHFVKVSQYVQTDTIDTGLIKNWQLEEGTTPTEYEPYKEYTKTFYLNSPLLEGDTIEEINGVATHVKRYEKIVLDGSEDEDWYYDSYYNVFIRSELPTKGGYIANTGIDVIDITWNGVSVLGINCIKHNITSKEEGIGLLQANPTTVVYQLASPIYEPISNESILCDSYANGHLDFDSAVPIEKVQFNHITQFLRYLNPSTKYKIQFDSDNEGVLYDLGIGSSYIYPQDVTKGVNIFNITTLETLPHTVIRFNGIGFNASNIVVTEAIDADFDYFNGIQSTFEENLVTDENNPHYGKYRVIYRTKSSDGNASTVKSVYLNSPLLQGDKLVVVNGKLCHYHKMGKVVLDGSENWKIDAKYIRPYFAILKDNYLAELQGKNLGMIYSDNLIGVKNTDRKNKEISIGDSYQFAISVDDMINANDYSGSILTFKQWLSKNPTTVVYELASPYYEEISSNPKDTVVDFYANGTLEVQSAVYPLSMEFTSFEEELTYLYASTVYTVQFEANGNATVDITLGGTTVTNQEITHGLNRIQVTTPSTLVDNKLIIDGCGNCRISNIVVTNSIKEFDYFEGMKSSFEDKQNEDGTYTVEIVVYNAPIRLNKDKE